MDSRTCSPEVTMTTSPPSSFSTSHNLPTRPGDMYAHVQTPSPKKRAAPSSGLCDAFVASPAGSAGPIVTGAGAFAGDSPAAATIYGSGGGMPMRPTPPVATNSSPAYSVDSVASPMTPTFTFEGLERPDLKRRKTAPADLIQHRHQPLVFPPGPPMPMPGADTAMSYASPAASPVASRRSSEKRPTGKDGTEVWPEDVEKAFYEALALIPKLGRRKVLVNGKPCGRNELIAEYIRKETGKLRSRKQVSSHIQVLKNMKRNDAEFMNMVAEPAEGDCEPFSQELSIYFGGIRPCGQSTGPSAPSAPAMSISLSDSSMLSPYAAAGFAMHRSPSVASVSSCGSPMPSPFAEDAPSPMPTSSSMAASPSLNTAFKGCTLAGSPLPNISISPSPVSSSCPVALASLCMWADSSLVDDTHVYVKVDPDKMAGALLPTMGVAYIEEVNRVQHGGAQRFPQLEQMHASFPCQFIYVTADIALTQSGGFYEHLDNLNTQLSLHSSEDLKLASYMTIYSGGRPILPLAEPLPPAHRLMPSQEKRGGGATGSASSSPATSPEGPITPGSSMSSSSPVSAARHKFVYNAPFATDFFGIFLRGSDAQAIQAGGNASFASAPEERVIMANSVGAISIVQEFVVENESGEMRTDALSAGSAAGDVVLVVVYDFTCSGATTPSSSVAMLRSHQGNAAPHGHPGQLSAFARMQQQGVQRAPSPLSMSHNSTVASPTIISTDDVSSMDSDCRVIVGDTTLPTPPDSTHKRQSTQQRRSLNKPNLTINLSAATLGAPGTSSALHTPNPQIIHTPTHPPPMVMPSSPTMANRLQEQWHAQSGMSVDAGLHSPALFASIPLQHPVSGQLSALTQSAMGQPTPTFAHFPEGLTAAPSMHPLHAQAALGDMHFVLQAFEPSVNQLSASGGYFDGAYF